MRYAWAAFTLLATRCISARTFFKALREKPIAVCGKGGSYVVDPDFEVGD
ncbi:hypothetical protein [Candidatus Burkholderia verschuerenii]|nr:hypothetical protein [Candidatus Burkholderia verschuerenii]